MFSFGGGMLIVPSANGEIKIYQGETLGLVQSIWTGRGKVWKVVSAENRRMFAAGKANGLVQIYVHNGSEYQKTQEFNVGFPVFGLLLDSKRLIVSGISAKVCVYESAGTEYWPHQTIETIEPLIYDLFASEDLEQLFLGGHSGRVSTYENVNGSYTLAEEIFIGEIVGEVFADEKELYLMIQTINSMITYYRCPD